MTDAAASAPDTFDHASEWLFATPGAEARFRSERTVHAIAEAIEALADGRPVDIAALQAAIGGPRIIAEALAAFIEWRFAPPVTGTLQ